MTAVAAVLSDKGFTAVQSESATKDTQAATEWLEWASNTS